MPHPTIAGPTVGRRRDQPERLPFHFGAASPLTPSTGGDGRASGRLASALQFYFVFKLITEVTMMRQLTNLHAIIGIALLGVMLSAPQAQADVWNEKTELTFTEPIIIPGATLQPGAYVFRLSESSATRNLVRVYNTDGMELVTIAQAVPMRRNERVGDTILKFNPTDRGMPALKGWFYPGQTTGHEFIYSEEQARQIAERSKTVVLSVDVVDTDLEQGTLHVLHPSGTRTEYRADPDTAREWQAWQRDRAARMQESREPATNAPIDKDDVSAKTSAPMMAGAGAATHVELDELEENTTAYVGKSVSVDGEVEEVYSPRLFTIDEAHWGDLDGEVLVYAPSMLAALVKDDDRVTVTGTVKSMAIGEIRRELGWFELDPDIEVEFLKKPVLVAERIVGGDNDVAMSIEMTQPEPAATPTAAAPKTAGEADAARAGMIMELGLIGKGTSDLVGRQVDLKNVRVLRPAQGGGFFVDAPDAAVLVRPAHDVTTTVAPGDELTLRGAIADAPRNIGQRLDAPSGWNDQIYIIATAVSK
jgi:hypothetical protein